MARKLIDQLFANDKHPPSSSRVVVSFQSWKALVSRLQKVEKQVKECQQNTETLNKLIKQWLQEDKNRLQDRENTLSSITHTGTQSSYPPITKPHRQSLPQGIGDTEGPLSPLTGPQGIGDTEIPLSPLTHKDIEGNFSPLTQAKEHTKKLTNDPYIKGVDSSASHKKPLYKPVKWDFF